MKYCFRFECGARASASVFVPFPEFNAKKICAVINGWWNFALFRSGTWPITRFPSTTFITSFAFVRLHHETSLRCTTNFIRTSNLILNIA